MSYAKERKKRACLTPYIIYVYAFRRVVCSVLLYTKVVRVLPNRSKSFGVGANKGQFFFLVARRNSTLAM